MSAFQDWETAYRKFQESGQSLVWPSETLVRLFKGDYIPQLDKNYVGKRALDISFGCGNNLLFMQTLGLEVHGTEVTEGMCADMRRRLEALGRPAELRVGTNRSLPYPDGFFDFLVSWNVIHYENNEADMRAAIKEYHRCLKPGGRLLLSTTGPEHRILEGGITLGGHRYQIGCPDDFRVGQVYFYFDAPNYLHHYFAPPFVDVQVGRTHDRLFTHTLDWFLLTGLRGS
jgi:ubiquinone/menaquinone biosynthesis C-methylase UbiE